MYRNFIKPIFDILVGIILSVITFPFLLILMILIRLNSKGSPIFSQIRVGKNAKHFKIYKLRSMYVHAPSVGSHSTQEHDPRITSIGRIIRKTSLDELPQLWNLVTGDMSMIGPRPDVPAQKNLYTDLDWQERLSVKPGITGLAQALYRSQATYEERLSADLKYVREVNFLLDCKIVFLTILVLSKRNKSN